MLALAFVTCLALATVANAQITYPLASVREDFNEASVVARVNMTDTKLDGCDNYACEYTVVSDVTHVFKGNVKRGQVLRFGARSDKEVDYNKIRGDAIVFLTSFVNRQNGPFQILPSGFSINTYSTDLVAKIRRVIQTSRQRRYNSKRTAKHNKSLDARLDSLHLK